MKTIRIASASKDGKHLIITENFLKEVSDVENEFGFNTIVNFFKNDGTGLSKNYNREIEKSLEEDSDYLILIHSDVSFNYRNLIEKILKTSSKYDVVGLAGTKKINLSVSPLTWFTGSREFSNQRYGRVIHKEFNLGESFFNGFHNPNATDVEVATIDGLCLVLNKKTLKSSARFDERFTFDFYDLDFCLTALTKEKLKLGVIIEPVVHASVGTSILRPEYLIEEKKFREKWNLL